MKDDCKHDDLDEHAAGAVCNVCGCMMLRLEGSLPLAGTDDSPVEDPEVEVEIHDPD